MLSDRGRSLKFIPRPWQTFSFAQITSDVEKNKLMNSFFKSRQFFSFFYFTGNEFICDCRLAWLFDLKNRTKNFELRYSLEEVECIKTKDRPSGGRIRVSPDDVMKKQVLNDDPDYDYESENFDEKKTTQLFQFKQRELPCPQQYREQFEHPSAPQFIGIDFSWIRSSATKLHNPFAVLGLALITHFACALTAFFR